MNKLNFVDLFCGIGAFHEAITKSFANLNADCKLAIDNNKQKEKMYKSLFPSFPEERFLCKDIGDKEVIKVLTSAEVDYDILCAGFPCQPYSRAGEKKGQRHSSGNSFRKMMNIVELYNNSHPENELRILMLENVDYLAKHNGEKTWSKMKEKIKKLGYVFPDSYFFADKKNTPAYQFSKELITNPLDLSNTPLNRPRLFLIAFHKNFYEKKKEKEIIISKCSNKNKLSIYKNEWLQPVDKNAIALLEIERERERVLEIWSEFLLIIPYYDLPHPLWLEFFFSVPSSKKKNISTFLKSFYKRGGPNEILKLLENEEKLKKHEKFDWKIKFAQKNWNFYLKYKEKIDKWWKIHKKTLRKKKTYCKLELNIKNYYLTEKFKDFFFEDRCIIQFRHSGIRIKPSTYFPTVTRHSSLIIVYDKNWKKYRYLSQQEMLKIFGFSQWKEWKEQEKKAEFVSSLGESISVSVLKTIIENFRSEIEKIIGDKRKSICFIEKPGFQSDEVPFRIENKKNSTIENYECK